MVPRTDEPLSGTAPAFGGILGGGVSTGGRIGGRPSAKRPCGTCAAVLNWWTLSEGR